MKYPETPDGRYFVAKNRLWRKSNPTLDETDRTRFVKNLMDARRAIAKANKTNDDELRQEGRRKVQMAKENLGERGPVWWKDGEADQTRLHPKNTSYSKWWFNLSEEDKKAAAS